MTVTLWAALLSAVGSVGSGYLYLRSVRPAPGGTWDVDELWYSNTRRSVGLDAPETLEERALCEARAEVAALGKVIL